MTVLADDKMIKPPIQCPSTFIFQMFEQGLTYILFSDIFSQKDEIG